jgi:FMN reductase
VSARLVAVSAGDSPTSKTRALAKAALDAGGGGELIDLLSLPAEGLLGRIEDADVSSAVALAAGAQVLVVATPIYRATYTGALKAFFDRFPTDGLAGTAVVLTATAGSPLHFLALDTGLRPMIASLAGFSVPTTVYATSADFADGEPNDTIRDLLKKALAEADRVAG